MAEQRLTDEQVRALREKLEARRSELHEELVGSLEQSSDARLNDLAGRVRDAGDESLAMHAAELNLIEYKHWVEEADAIERALADMRAGIYGFCEDCQRLIGYERLQAAPTARRCVACQQRREPSDARHGDSL